MGTWSFLNRSFGFLAIGKSLNIVDIVTYIGEAVSHSVIYPMKKKLQHSTYFKIILPRAVLHIHNIVMNTVVFDG